MISSTFGPSLTRRDTAKSSIGHENTYGTVPPPLTGGGSTFGPQSAGVIYQHIHDMATKRISTLDYLRKASVGSEKRTTYSAQQRLVPVLLTSFAATRDAYTGSIRSISPGRT